MQVIDVVDCLRYDFVYFDHRVHDETFRFDLYFVCPAHSVRAPKEGKEEKKNTENVRYDCSRDVPKQKAAGATLTATLGLR